ncbi:MAG: hypothetical protein IJ545_00795 [Alphaproteobacteria bacterium]|nr:hypothetical protein [Alphaproteobacteria bacterium]
MKALKISLIFGLLIIGGTYFNNSIAQTFGDAENNEMPPISVRQQLIVDLLKKEIKSNPDFLQSANAIQENLDAASIDDEIGPNCYKYSPLLVEAVNSKTSFIDFFYIQGNFKYSFKQMDNTKPIITAFNFYEWYDNGSLEGILSSVNIYGSGIEKNIENEEAVNYILDNYCKPLNQILDQNPNRPISQLLEILRQYFSK